MTAIRIAVLSTLLAVCGSSQALAKEKKPTRSTQSADEDTAASKRLTLVERSSPKGFSIKVPENATATQDQWSSTYKLLLPAEAAPVTVTVTPETLDELTPITHLDKAVEFLSSKRSGPRKPTPSEQRELPNGYLVVFGPDYDIHAVHVIRNGKEVQVQAHCTGPSARLAELKEMCLSVKATK